MTNPFEKQSNAGVIAAVLFGSVAIGAVAYLFLTDNSSEIRGKTKKRLKAFAKEKAIKAVSEKTGFPTKAVKAVADHVLKH
jgi:hypothetical protein